MIDSFSLMDEKEATELRFALRRIARIPIDSVEPDAVVKIRGFVSTEDRSLRAPMTGVPCALYHLDWREVAVSDDWWDLLDDHTPGGSARPVGREVRGYDLVLDDGSSRALVRVDRAQLSLLGNWATSLSAPRVGNGAVPERSPPAGPRLRDRDRCVAYRELKVGLGSLVTVIGRAAIEPDPGPIVPSAGDAQPYRTSQRRCVFAASQSSPLYIVQELIASLDAVG